MDMKMLKDIEYRACKELEEIFQKKDWSFNDFSALHNLTGTVKNLKKIEEHEMGGAYAMSGQNGYVHGGRWTANGTMEGEYGHNMNYSGRHRDSMGRYTSDGGYSQHGDNTVAMLEEKLRNARTEREREDIRRCMEVVKNM